MDAGGGLTFSTGSMVTVAGNGTIGSGGNNGPATAAQLGGPMAWRLTLPATSIIADSLNNEVREVVKATGQIITVAGNGVPGYSGDNGPAAAAELNDPTGVAVDAAATSSSPTARTTGSARW